MQRMKMLMMRKKKMLMMSFSINGRAMTNMEFMFLKAWLHDRPCQGLLHTQIMLVRIKEKRRCMLHALDRAHPARAIACLLQ